MAMFFEGNSAPYRPGFIECTWCTAKNAGGIGSSSYNSCVGMVLWSLRHKIGVVAHFSGSMVDGDVSRDVSEILRRVCPVLPGIWDGWVFGGLSLADSDVSDARKDRTKEMIDIVRRTLKINPYIPVNFRPLSRLRDVEMKESEYASHYGVNLDVATGNVTWLPAPASAQLGATAATKSRERKSSLSGKPKKPWV